MWVTGDSLNGYSCRTLRIPGDIYFYSAVSGALYELTLHYNWEQMGTVTPDEAVAAMTEMYREFLDSDCMIGSIVPFATVNPPQNVLVCDGTSYLRDAYPKLYDVLLPAYIIDADNFVVPDLRERFVYGAGSTWLPSSFGGEADVTLTTAEIPSHTHTDAGHTHTDAGHTHSETTTAPSVGGEIPAAGAVGIPGITGVGFANIQSAAANIQSAGGDGPHNNLPPFLALQYGIIAR